MFLAKMKLGSNGWGWNPMLTFQIPSAEIRDNCKAAVVNVVCSAPVKEMKQCKQVGKDHATNKDHYE